MYCPKCGAQVPDNASFCQACGAPLSAAPANAAAPAMGMKWHKFLIYFALFASAVINLVNALQLITGLQYGDAADAVYAMFSTLKVLDIGYGVILLATVVYTVVTRFYLAKFKASGPLMLMMLYFFIDLWVRRGGSHRRIHRPGPQSLFLKQRGLLLGDDGRQLGLL